TIKMATTKPVIVGTKSPASNAAGWNKANTTVAFACTDPSPGSGPVSSVVSGGGTFTTATLGTTSSSTGPCEDMAGNDAAGPVSGAAKPDNTKATRTPPGPPGPNPPRTGPRD